MSDKNFQKNSKPVTMEELNQLHDEWWASLTDEDKERLYNEMVESEVQYYSDKTDQ
jgi:hypothetical protein|tara:strand:- start:421 stop:588 length:168 start_codon:yes stop_codon:yes gene_type:complete